MGFGFFVVVAAAVAGGYYGYRKLQQIEEDIRSEIAAKGLADDQPQAAPPSPKVEPATASAETVAPAVEKSEASLETQVLEVVRQSPGLLQTELYQRFASVERKTLQTTLLRMDKSGVLSREKAGSSYRLHIQ